MNYTLETLYTRLHFYSYTCHAYCWPCP